MVPILRSAIASGGRSVVCRGSFNTNSKAVGAGSNTREASKDAVGTRSKSFLRYVLRGYCVYIVWESLNIWEYHGTRVAYAEETTGYGKAKQGEDSFKK